MLDLSDLPLPMRMQPGLQRCERVDLHPLQPGSALQQEKQALVAAGWQPLSVPGFDAGPVEQTVRAVAGLQADEAGPLALLIEEDLAVLDGASGTLPWLSICTPSHWAPEDKLGLHWSAVHAPVADNTALMAAQRQLIALSTNGQCWLRVERQGFFPVQGRPGQAVFSIRLQLERLDRSASEPARAARLHEWLATMSPAVADYKGLSPARDRLLQFLAERAR